MYVIYAFPLFATIDENVSDGLSSESVKLIDEALNYSSYEDHNYFNDLDNYRVLLSGGCIELMKNFKIQESTHLTIELNCEYYLAYWMEMVNQYTKEIL